MGQEGGYGAVADAGGGAAQPGHAGEGTSLPQSCTRSLGREEAEERQERKEEEVTPRPDCRALPVFGSLSLSQRRWWPAVARLFCSALAVRLSAHFRILFFARCATAVH